jgi:hypothetical protein
MNGVTRGHVLIKNKNTKNSIKKKLQNHNKKLKTINKKRKLGSPPPLPYHQPSPPPCFLISFTISTISPETPI